MSEATEGELSYHARMFEGGKAIYLIPQLAKIVYIDEGRSMWGESFYRNSIGDTYHPKNQRKWDNFFISDESGGTKILENLKKMFVENRLAETIFTTRISGEKVYYRGSI